MKSYKPLVIIVALLILVNCSLIGTLWYTSYHYKQLPVIQGRADNYLARVLKLTPQQLKQYDTLRRQHHQFTQEIQETQRLQRDSFFDNLKNPSASATAAAALEKRILVNQGKLDSATYNHFKSLRAILTASQQTIFDEVINDVLHSMSRPHPQGPPPQGLGPQNNMRQLPPNNMPLRPHQPGQGPPPGWPNRGPHRQGPPPGGFSPDGPPPDGPPPDGPPNLNGQKR